MIARFGVVITEVLRESLRQKLGPRAAATAACRCGRRQRQQRTQRLCAPQVLQWPGAPDPAYASGSRTSTSGSSWMSVSATNTSRNPQPPKVDIIRTNSRIVRSLPSTVTHSSSILSPLPPRTNPLDDVPTGDPLVRALFIFELRLAHGDLDSDQVLCGHKGVPSLDAVVPEFQDLLVRHHRELLTAHLEVGGGNALVGVDDDRIVSVPGDLDLVGGGLVRASWSGHSDPLTRKAGMRCPTWSGQRLIGNPDVTKGFASVFGAPCSCSQCPSWRRTSSRHRHGRTASRSWHRR